MEYLAKKSFSFLQDFAFISKSILKNIYRFIYFSLVYFFAKNSFISTSKVFYNQKRSCLRFRVAWLACFNFFFEF